MGRPTVTLVTDDNCGFQAIYYDGKLVADVGDNFTARRDTGYWSIDETLDELCARMDVPYESIGGWQLAEKFVGFDYVEWDGYWPEDLKDVPRDERTYGPEDDVRTDGDDTIPIG